MVITKSRVLAKVHLKTRLPLHPPAPLIISSIQMLAASICTSLRPFSPNVPMIVLDRPGNKSYGRTPGVGDPRRQDGYIHNDAHHQNNEPAPLSFALTPPPPVPKNPSTPPGASSESQQQPCVTKATDTQTRTRRGRATHRACPKAKQPQAIDKSIA